MLRDLSLLFRLRHISVFYIRSVSLPAAYVRNFIFFHRLYDDRGELVIIIIVALLILIPIITKLL